MKKIMVTLLSCMFFFALNAQVVNFQSLGTATLERDAKGNFSHVKHFIVQEMRISVNLTQNKLQFFSKGIFDRDNFDLKKEITILSKITSPNTSNEQMTKVFSGMDEQGIKCIVRFELIKDDDKIQDGKLQVEYIDHAESYNLRSQRDISIF
jgi:hypothetical protein